MTHTLRAAGADALSALFAAGRTPANAFRDLISEQWLLPPMSDAAQEVALAS